MGLVNEVRHNSLLKLVIVVLYLVAVVSSAGDEEVGCGLEGKSLV